MSEGTREGGTRSDAATQVGREVVLNALVDVHVEGYAFVADDASRRIVDAAFERAVEPANRAAYVRHIEELADLSTGEFRGDHDRLYDLADAVCAELDAAGIRAVFDHRACRRFDSRQVATYAFARSPGPEALEGLDLPSPARSAALEGADLAADGAFDRAADRFESAVDAAGAGPWAPTLRSLAGWSLLFAGDADRAALLADEALDLEWDAWDAKMLWMAATNVEVDRVVAGEVDVGVVLRWIAPRTDPDELTVRTGLAVPDGEIEWTDRETAAGWVLLEAIAPETWVGFRIETPVGGFAGMEAYYLGPATFDTEWGELKEIERVLLSGPETADPIETVRFVR